MAWCTSTLVEGGHEISSPTEKKRGLGRNQLIIIDLLIERRSVPVISRYFACRKDFSDVTSLYRGSDFLPLDTSGSRNTWRVHSSLKPTLISANHVSALSSLNKSCSRPNFSLKHSFIFLNIVSFEELARNVFASLENCLSQTKVQYSRP